MLTDSTSGCIELVFTLEILSSAVVPYRLPIQANSSSALTSALTLSKQQLNSIGNICELSRVKENHGKSFALFFKWLLMLLPMSLSLWATVHVQRLIVFKKFIFPGHISLTSTVKHDLINSPSINGFPCLTNKLATQKLTLATASFSFFNFCEEIRYKIFHFKLSNFSNQCFPVSWEHCSECLICYVCVYCILLAMLQCHCIINTMLWHLIWSPNSLHLNTWYSKSTFIFLFWHNRYSLLIFKTATILWYIWHSKHYWVITVSLWFIVNWPREVMRAPNSLCHSYSTLPL